MTWNEEPIAWLDVLPEWVPYVKLDWAQWACECMLPTDDEIAQVCGPEYLMWYKELV